MNRDLPRKTARIPFDMLPDAKIRYAKLSGKKTTVVRIEPNFKNSETIELDPTTFNTVGEDVEIEFIEKLPTASEVTITIKGPYQPSDSTLLLIGLPFMKGEEYEISAYKITINDADESMFIVESMTDVKSTFIPEIVQEVDIMNDIFKKITRAIDVLTQKPCPKGILITGLHGTGKTYFMQKLVSTSPRDFKVITAKDVKEGKKLLANFVKSYSQAKNDGAKIIIDDLDEICQKCPTFPTVLKSIFDEPDKNSNPVIIATATMKSRIPSELLSPCRFGVHIKTRLPTLEERIKLLKGLGINDEKIARELEGYSVGDIYKLIVNMIVDDVQITPENVRTYKKKHPPTTLMNYQMEIPNVHWDDIGGLEKVKKELQKAVEWPLKYPEYFKQLNIDPPRGILLYGPPGTGKTLLARAVATESGANFISVRAPEILDKYYGVSEARIKEIFERARQSKPSIIFIDEIDAIGVRRGTTNHGIDSIINQLLVELDGITENDGIIVIAATNRPDVLDPALLRPGRFEKLIHVPLPNAKERVEIFKVHLRNKPVSPDVRIEDLAYYTEGMSGAEIESIVREAGYIALERSIKEGTLLEITMKDLMEAIKKIGGDKVENRGKTD